MTICVTGCCLLLFGIMPLFCVGPAPMPLLGGDMADTPPFIAIDAPSEVAGFQPSPGPGPML